MRVISLNLKKDHFKKRTFKRLGHFKFFFLFLEKLKHLK